MYFEACKTKLRTLRESFGACDTSRGWTTCKWQVSEHSQPSNENAASYSNQNGGAGTTNNARRARMGQDDECDDHDGVNEGFRELPLVSRMQGSSFKPGSSKKKYPSLLLVPYMKTRRAVRPRSIP